MRVQAAPTSLPASQDVCLHHARAGSTNSLDMQLHGEAAHLPAHPPKPVAPAITPHPLLHERPVQPRLPAAPVLPGASPKPALNPLTPLDPSWPSRVPNSAGCASNSPVYRTSEGGRAVEQLLEMMAALADDSGSCGQQSQHIHTLGGSRPLSLGQSGAHWGAVAAMRVCFAWRAVAGTCLWSPPPTSPTPLTTLPCPPLFTLTHSHAPMHTHSRAHTNARMHT